MDVKDYSREVEQVRDKFRQAQDELRTTHDKDTANIKANADYRINKISKTFDDQKTKLEEQNHINNENYSAKVKQTVADKSERFRTEIKKNSEKFDGDRNQMKSEFQDKLSNLSTSYKKSTEENNRFHDQALKTTADRYNKANTNYKADFDNQITKLDKKNRDDFTGLREDMHQQNLDQEKGNQENLEKLRFDGNEAKFREVSRLRDDNENLRTTFEQERNSLRDQQEGRINDIMNITKAEREEGQRNFNNLQEDIRKKTHFSDQKLKNEHLAENKAMEKRFNEDLRNVQRMTNQKIKGGNEVTQLKDENKQLVEGQEERIGSLREEMRKNAQFSTEKEKAIDEGYREKLKTLKLSNVEALDKREQDILTQTNKTMRDIRDQNSNVIDRYKNDVVKVKADGEARLSQNEVRSTAQLKNQRVEFGKYINNVNDRNMEELASIKDELSKDKTNFIEKTKREVSVEKNQLKETYYNQMSVKEDLYEQKLSEMEKQTHRIIQNYEKRMNSLARKSEKEVEDLKSMTAARAKREEQAVQIAFENQNREHEIEMNNMRSKFENIIGKDRAINDLKTNQLVQKYEDRIERERADQQKEAGLKLGEAQSQIERLFKQSELEKETLRNQFEQRIETLKNSALTQGSKKA
jgi:hypothetical protein